TGPVGPMNWLLFGAGSRVQLVPRLALLDRWSPSKIYIRGGSWESIARLEIEFALMPRPVRQVNARSRLAETPAWLPANRPLSVASSALTVRSGSPAPARCQVAPPSVLRKTPSRGVPAKTVDEPGSTARAQTFGCLPNAVALPCVQCLPPSTLRYGALPNVAK